MAFATTAIRYGWVALTSLGVLTGVTIYVVNNTRQQVEPEDIIEIVLGTDERCMRLQTGTNGDGSPSYPVARPSFVRTWTSNVYTTNGVTVYTNIVTNTIGWHIDRDMMVSLDTTIKDLIPYYVDTSSIYDGTPSIVFLTVTGLFASLQIGDKTNQFTRSPARTNHVSTNWVVSYVSYWPSTNGTATNICYTSDYRQVVNYAQSWTATGGHVWVASSNWASSVVTVTSPATYGDYPWQIYVEDLQERYKVLNALKIPKAIISISTVGTNIQKSGVGSAFTNVPSPAESCIAYPDIGIQMMEEAKSEASSGFILASVSTNSYTFTVHAYSIFNWFWQCGWTDGGAYGSASLRRGAQKVTGTAILANPITLGTLDSFVLEVVTTRAGGWGDPQYHHYDGNGDFPIEGTNIVATSPWTEATNTISADIGSFSLPSPSWGANYGGGYVVTATRWIVTYKNPNVNTNFLYCTNKYW